MKVIVGFIVLVLSLVMYVTASSSIELYGIRMQNRAIIGTIEQLSEQIRITVEKRDRLAQEQLDELRQH